MLEGLDPKVHYIFSGFYAATVEIDGQTTWTLVTGKNSFSNEEKELLLAKEATPENIQSLKNLISKTAPMIAPLF